MACAICHDFSCRVLFIDTLSFIGAGMTPWLRGESRRPARQIETMTWWRAAIASTTSVVSSDRVEPLRSEEPQQPSQQVFVAVDLKYDATSFVVKALFWWSDWGSLKRVCMTPPTGP